MSLTEAEHLANLEPSFREKIKSILIELRTIGYTPIIEHSFRTLEEQKKLCEKSRTQFTFGFHNFTNDKGKPAAEAVDIVDAKHRHEGKESREFFRTLAAIAQARGLTSGYFWRTMPEFSHIQSRSFDKRVKHR